MTEVILGQLRFILWMMCGGMAILAGYDVLRLFRWLVPHGAVWDRCGRSVFLGRCQCSGIYFILKNARWTDQMVWCGCAA